MKEKIGIEYLRHVKLLAKSRLYSRNLVCGINAVSVVQYSAGILGRLDAELRRIDKKTRKVLTMDGAFHRNISVSWLYIERKDEGRGLISVENCVRQ